MKQIRYRQVNKLEAKQQIPRTLWNQNVHCRVQNSSIPITVFSQINPVDIQLPNTYKTHFNTFLPSTNSSIPAKTSLS